jgi:membrane associated rhomboid family serine protease
VECALALRRAALVAALERQLGDASATPAEMRHVTRALADLVGDHHAASALLGCYSAKIGRQQQQLIKQFASGVCLFFLLLGRGGQWVGLGLAWGRGQGMRRHCCVETTYQGSRLASDMGT